MAELKKKERKDPLGVLKERINIPKNQGENSEGTNRPSDLPPNMTDRAYYIGWDITHEIESDKDSFISYKILKATVVNWKETRVNLIEHNARILAELAKLGTTSFYGEHKRFAGKADAGFSLYVNLSYPALQTIMASLIVSLQTVKGEGREKRLGKDNTVVSGQDESSLSIAKQLSEFDSLLGDPAFIESAVFTQRTFETKKSLTWSTTART